MADQPLLLAVRHCGWANAKLLEFCARLTPDQLAWTTSGTYGSIHATLAHLVGAELGYLFGLTNEIPGGMMRSDPLPSFDELLSRERSNGERIDRVVANGFDPARVVARPNRPLATAGVVVVQYVHHGSDHRAHVGSILGAHGIEPPDLDVWAYGRARGLVGDALKA